MAILLPELAEEELTGAIDRVSGYISAENGSIKEILNDSPWGRRRLAYTIRYNGRDYRDGIYVIWHFDLEPSRMTEVERELKLDTRVIRYLVVHDDPKWNSPAERQQQSEAAEAAAATPAAAAVADEAAPTDAPAEGTTEAGTPADEAEAPVAEAAAVADAPVEEAADVAGTEVAEAPAAEVAEAGTEPEAPASAPVEGASGVETTTVVDDTTGAAVEAPVEDTAVEGSDENDEEK